MPAEAFKIIGLKTFRAHLSSLLKKADKENLRLILMRHSEPVVEIRPLSKRERTLEKFAIQIFKSRQEYQEGRYYTHEEMMKELGLL